MDPLVLYSVNSHLAYTINKEYYGKHFVWCATKFNTDELSAPNRNNPPSSNPLMIYRQYVSDLKQVQIDRHFHSRFLNERINGIKNGLEANKHTIGEEIYDELTKEIEKQQASGGIWNELKPLIYVIPFALVKDRVIKASPAKAACFSSEEYIITDLKSNEFDIIVEL